MTKKRKWCLLGCLFSVLLVVGFFATGIIISRERLKGYDWLEGWSGIRIPTEWEKLYVDSEEISWWMGDGRYYAVHHVSKYDEKFFSEFVYSYENVDDTECFENEFSHTMEPPLGSSHRISPPEEFLPDFEEDYMFLLKKIHYDTLYMVYQSNTLYILADTK